MFGLAGLRLYGAIGAAVVIALFLAWVWRIDSLRAQHKKETAACQAAFEQFKADVAAKTELARISDAAHKARVERDQEKVRSETDAEIRRRIADAVAAVRLRGNAKAGGGGSRGETVPGPATAASDPVGESAAPIVSAVDLEICAVNTVKAEGWLNWWRGVMEIER